MRDGWDVKPLKEVCLIKPPKSEARKGQNADFLVSFAPMETLGIDQKYLITNQTRTMSDVIGSYTYFTNGDVLLAKITPCFENGKLGIASDLINNIGFGSSEYIVFRANEQLDAEWLYYYLSRQSFRNEGASRMAGAVGHKRITKDFIEDYPIPIPPLPEQRRIVAILDEVFEGIATAKANAEKNLQNAREVFESHRDATLSNPEWPIVRIDEVCESIVDCVNKTAPTVDGPTPFKMIRTTNVRNGRISLESVNYVTEEIFLAWTRRQVPKRGDIILTREAPMGEVGILLSDDKIFLGQRLVSYRANLMKLDNRFLFYAMTSSAIQQEIRSLASGSTVQHMRVPDSKKLQFPLPDLNQQRKLADNLDMLLKETQHLESLYQQKLTALDELKQSLLHQAFNGDL